METKINFTEATEPRIANKNNKKNETPKMWKSVLVGGVPGIIIGMGGAAVLEAAAAAPAEESQPIFEAEAQEESVEILVAKSVNDDMSYSEAFAAARKEVGAGGAFVWHGNVYGTHRGDDAEWLEMSAEERSEYCKLIMSQVHRTPYTPKADEPEIVEENTENAESEQDAAETSEENGNEVHIIGVGVVSGNDGSIVTYGVGEINDHYAELIDIDTDGEIDAVLVDTDNDGQVSPNEVFDVTEASFNNVEDILMSAVQNIDDLGDANLTL